MQNTTEFILTELAAANGGALSRAQAHDRGIGRSTLHRRQRSGLLIPITNRAFIHSGLRTDHSVLHALGLAFPSGAVARHTAAALSGLPVRPRPFHFVVAHGARPNHQRNDELSCVHIHETRHLPSADVERRGGLPLTSVARTLVDIAPFESDRFLIHLTERALADRTLTNEAMIACLGERVRRGVRSSRRLARILCDTLADQDIGDSRFELHVLEALQRQGLSGLIPQYVPPWFDGIRGVTDIGCPIGDTIVECDGRSFRRVTAAHDNDRRRDRVAAHHGFLTIRIGYREFYRSPDEVAAEVAEIIRDRRNERARRAS